MNSKRSAIWKFATNWCQEKYVKYDEVTQHIIITIRSFIELKKKIFYDTETAELSVVLTGVFKPVVFEHQFEKKKTGFF